MDLKFAFFLAAGLVQVMFVGGEESSYRQQNGNDGRRGGNDGYGSQSGNNNYGRGNGNNRGGGGFRDNECTSLCPACWEFENRLFDEYDRLRSTGESNYASCRKDVRQCKWEDLKRASHDVEEMNLNACWNELRMLYKMEGITN